MGKFTATRIADGYTEDFDSPSEFVKKYELHHKNNPDGIYKMLAGRINTYKGWTVVNNEETDEQREKREAKIAARKAKSAEKAQAKKEAAEAKRRAKEEAAEAKRIAKEEGEQQNG